MIEKKIQGFSTVGTAKDNRGQVVARDLFIGVDDKVYALTVATPTHIERIRERNKHIPDPDLKADEVLLPVPEEVIVDFNQVYATINGTPFPILEPYLREQIVEEDIG